MYCGLPFYIAKYIKQKYRNKCMQCQHSPCAFYQLFDQFLHTTISIMEGNIAMKQVCQFLYNQYAYRMELTCIGGGHLLPPVGSELSKADSDSDSGPSLVEIYNDANGTLLPSCVLRKIYKVFHG